MKFKSKLTTEEVVCSELKVKDYKEILKCTLGDEPDPDAFVETITEVLEKTTNKDKNFFKELPITDLFLLLLDIRTNSQGNLLKVIVTKNEKEMTLDLDLNSLRNELFELCKKQLQVEQDGLKITLESPSLVRLLEQDDEEYLSFIKKATYNNTNTQAKVKTNKEARLLFDSLTPKLSLKLIEQFEKTIKLFFEHNFLQKYEGIEQKFTILPSLSSFIWFVKLIFNESLENVYNNIFYLSHLGHMNSDYIDNCSVGEYTLFSKILERTLSSRNSTESFETETDITSTEFDDSGMFENEN